MLEHNIPNSDSSIIALTAYTTDLFSKKCIDCGMDKFLTKPISAEEIKKTVNEAF